MSVYTFKNCPFCLNNKELESDNDRDNFGFLHWFIKCDKCGMRGPIAFTEEEAVLYWNDREEIEE